jgi:hypothetical protein
LLGEPGPTWQHFRGPDGSTSSSPRDADAGPGDRQTGVSRAGPR